MSLDSQIKRHPGTTVFCRNHRDLLEEAIEISTRDPQQLILFRARTVWRAADYALGCHGPRPIYFLPIVESDVPDDCIHYVGTLHQVVLRPSDTDATHELLRKSVPRAMNEGLWPDQKGKPTVRTLYLVSNVRRVPSATRIHYYDLKKMADDEDIDPDFGYSYAIVHGHSELDML